MPLAMGTSICKESLTLCKGKIQKCFNAIQDFFALFRLMVDRLPQFDVELGLSIGRFGSGLCPTRNRPEGIGWQKISPVADHRSRRVGWIRPSTVGRQVGQHHRFQKTTRKLRESSEKNLDPEKISSESMRFCQIRQKSHQI